MAVRDVSVLLDWWTTVLLSEDCALGSGIPFLQLDLEVCKVRLGALRCACFLLYPLGICVLCVIMFPLSLLCPSALLWWGLTTEWRGTRRIWGSYALSRSQSLLSASFRALSVS